MTDGISIDIGRNGI